MKHQAKDLQVKIRRMKMKEAYNLPLKADAFVPLP
jgi:hypothetical protein